MTPYSPALGAQSSRSVTWQAAQANPDPGSRESEHQGPFHRIALYCTIALLFIYFTRIHEVFGAVTGVNTRVLYIFTIPAFFGFLFSGGLRRALSARTTVLWLAFFLWMLFTTLTSTWRGGSAQTDFLFLRANLSLLLFLAGIPLVWRDTKKLVYTLGVAGLLHIVVAKIFEKDTAGRLGTEFESLGNPNDFAAILLLLLPAIVYLALYPPFLKWMWRLIAPPLVAFGFYQVLATASRGAVVAIGVAATILMARANMRQRLKLVAGLMTLVLVIVPFVPRATWSRLIAFTSNSGDAATDESTYLRQQLLKQAVESTIAHPLLGVGPQQFGNSQGNVNAGDRTFVHWMDCHNSYLQVAADMGFPGILLYLSAVISTFLALRRAEKVAREAGRNDIANACFCMFVGFAAYSVAIFFINFGYAIYFQGISGVVVAVARAAHRPAAATKAAMARLPLRPVPLAAAMPMAQAASPQGSARSRNAFRFNRYR